MEISKFISFKRNYEVFLIDDLKAKLGDRGYLWLCACAVFPKLNYDLTMQIGRLIEERCNTKLVDSKQSILFSLDWFRNGFIPDRLRKILIYSLDVDFEDYLRAYISDYLPKVLKNSFDSDPLYLSYTNSSIAFTIKKEIWKLFYGGRDHSLNGLSLARNLYLFNCFYPLIIINLLILLSLAISSSKVIINEGYKSISYYKLFSVMQGFDKEYLVIGSSGDGILTIAIIKLLVLILIGAIGIPSCAILIKNYYNTTLKQYFLISSNIYILFMSFTIFLTSMIFELLDNYYYFLVALLPLLLAYKLVIGTPKATIHTLTITNNIYSWTLMLYILFTLFIMIVVESEGITWYNFFGASVVYLILFGVCMVYSALIYFLLLSKYNLIKLLRLLVSMSLISYVPLIYIYGMYVSFFR